MQRWHHTAAWVIALLGLVLVSLAQNLPPTLELLGLSPISQPLEQPRPDPDPTAADPAADSNPPGSDIFTILGPFFVKLNNLLGEDDNALSAIAPYVLNDTDRLHFAVVAGEIEGRQAAREHLYELADSLPPNSPLAADTELFISVYMDGHQAIDQPDRDRLIQRHGAFARLALTNDLPETDPDYLGPRTGGESALAFFIGVTVAVILAGLIGLALFIAAAVLLGLGRLRPRMPSPGPSSRGLIEVLALFITAFAALQGLALLLPQSLQTPFSLLAQWLLLAVPAWPLLRGLSLSQWRLALGLHTGRGLFREIGAGLVGYLAGLPFLGLGFLISLAVILVVSSFKGPDAAPPSNPILETLAGSSPFEMILLALLACVWAPLCEELVFRGALYSRLRLSITRPAFSALITAAAFAAVHGYGYLLLAPVFALGFVFGLLRAWRGSIIACITAHALHNTSIALIVAGAIWVLT